MLKVPHKYTFRYVCQDQDVSRDIGDGEIIKIHYSCIEGADETA